MLGNIQPNIDWSSFRLGEGQKYESKNLYDQRIRDAQTNNAMKLQHKLQLDQTNWAASQAMQQSSQQQQQSQQQPMPQQDALTQLQQTIDQQIQQMTQQTQQIQAQTNAMLQQAQQRAAQQQAQAQNAASQANQQTQQIAQQGQQWLNQQQQPVQQQPTQQPQMIAGIPVQYVQEMQIATNAFVMEPYQLMQMGYTQQQAMQIQQARQAIDQKAVQVWTQTGNVDATVNATMDALMQNAAYNMSSMGMNIDNVNKYSQAQWREAMYPFIRDMVIRRMHENGLI